MAALTEISSSVLEHLVCPRCATAIFFVQILHDRLGDNQRMYECPRCHYEIEVTQEAPMEE
jgi:DNA-directed RNA polymerase subunit M/transcription elongation factor TFIIS